MTNKNFSMVDGKRIGFAPNLTPRKFRFDSLSNLSRQSLLPILLLCLTLFIGVGNAWGADETITFSSVCSADENLHEISKSGTDFSVYFNKGTNSTKPVYKTTGAAVRVYGGGYFIVSSSTKTIKKIELTFGTGDNTNTISTDVESYESGTWSGSASSVKFTIEGTSNHRRIASIAVTYESNTNYDVHWNVNGQTITTISTSGNPTVPIAATNAAESFDCEGKVFVGWSSAVVTGNAPVDLFTEQAGSAISGETTYNAVFATSSPSNEEIDITLTASDFDLTNSYATKTCTKGGFGFKVDKGYLGSNSSIQLNTNKAGKPGTLYNTSSIPGLKSVTLNVASGENTKTVYSSTSSNTKTNELGSTTSDDETFEVESGDTYFVIQVSGANYLSSVIVTYEVENVSYSNYTTTCCNPLGSINGSFS